MEDITRSPQTDTALRIEMVAQGRTQKWLVRELRAVGIKVDAAQVSDYCRGVHVPQPSTRLAIACALHKPVADLFPPELNTEESAAA